MGKGKKEGGCAGPGQEASPAPPPCCLDPCPEAWLSFLRWDSSLQRHQKTLNSFLPPHYSYLVDLSQCNHLN